MQADGAVSGGNGSARGVNGGGREVKGSERSQTARMVSRRARRAELEQLTDAGGVWATYRTVCQFRLGYLSFLVLVCILVFSFTLLMEIFFAIFLPSARADPLFTLRALALLAILPFALILLSYCFEEAARFFLDAVDKSEGGLANFRLSLAVCIHYLRHWREMPDDRVHQELSDLYHREDEDAAAWQRVVSAVMSLPNRFLAAIHTNDPFDDKNKEKEDERRQELELEFERQQLEAAATTTSRPVRAHTNSVSPTTSSDDEDSSDHLASNRWKKAVRAAKSTVTFQQTHFDGPPLDFSTLVIVDIVCPYLFEAVTMWTFTVSLLANLSPVHAFLDYVQCGFFMVGGYLVIWMVCHFCSARNRKMREFVSNYRRRRRDMNRRLQQMENEARAEYLWLLELGFRPYEYFDSLFFIGVERMFDAGEWLRARFPYCFPREQARSSEESIEEGRSSSSSSSEESQRLAAEESVPLYTAQSAASQTNYATMPSTTDVADPVAMAAVTTEANQPIEAIKGKQHVREIETRVHSRNVWSKFSYDRKLWILCPMVLVSAIISFMAFYIGWLLMGTCLILLGHTIQRKFPQIFGVAFRSFITSFVVLSFMFFTSTWAVGTFVQGGDFFVLPPASTPTQASWISSLQTAGSTMLSSPLAATMPSPPTSVWLGDQRGVVAQYPVCSLNFSSLDIVDFALIADAAYGHDTDVQKQSLGERFNGTALGDWKYVARNDARSSHQVWMELYFPRANLTVIAVRGTASATDALEDLHFWFGICIMQVADVFIPFLKQLPSAFVVQLLSMTLFRSIMPPPVYTELLAHVEAVRERVGGDRLVLTGHSLGGAMAAMVGAKTHAPAVSFSGPGLLYSRGRFDVEDNAIRDYVLTIKPRHDVVPQVDALGGMVQEIECRRLNPLACHSTVTHMCELVASCGDKRGRDWSRATQCQEYMATAVPETVVRL